MTRSRILAAMRLAAALAALIVCTAPPAIARGPHHNPSSHEYYRSSDGSEVHGPTTKTNATYGRVTADCRDGTHSYSHHHAGTCSGHGGVAEWR